MANPTPTSGNNGPEHDLLRAFRALLLAPFHTSTECNVADNLLWKDAELAIGWLTQAIEAPPADRPETFRRITAEMTDAAEHPESWEVSRRVLDPGRRADAAVAAWAASFPQVLS